MITLIFFGHFLYVASLRFLMFLAIFVITLKLNLIMKLNPFNVIMELNLAMHLFIVCFNKNGIKMHFFCPYTSNKLVKRKAQLGR